MDKLTATTNAIGSFQVIRQLYARGNVHIYLCEQKSTNQLVVLKHNRRKNAVSSESTTSRRVVVPRAAPHDTTPVVLDMTADSIDQELLVARLIQTHGGHRHVLNYLNVPTSKRQDTYVIMEYCRRGDLFTLLEQQPSQRFDEVTALHFFHQIVQGLQFLHQCVGIAHRDLSLENILVDEQWCLKICDFGLSTMVTRRSNETVGKLFYMAPEIVSGQVYDPILADIWSLGILLFIMLTGSPLYQIADPSDPGWNAVQRLGIGGLLKHWGLEHHISTPTITLLTSMLQVHPSRRLHSLESVVQHLVTYGH